ncbi:coiled-coil domain-containing protein 58-like isoform X2 [Penaeus monodon]|uniref:coiled-coil domain-containing protein 58-like isoform X2 n=1 Tax=Penaeus monodon TaxID=6687 RepID=UPI0018A73293|nr:coiled-coil domain-containing protein 58-like isoform X2 [Penaeus monodon]
MRELLIRKFPIEFVEGNDTLKEMRAIDDKIIYELNLATPTQSFRNEVDPRIHCKTLYDQLDNTYQRRGALIEHCMSEAREKVRQMREDVATKRDDAKFMRSLRNEQSKIRELQNELTIEEIVRERSLKVFEERCRQFYKPGKSD